MHYLVESILVGIYTSIVYLMVKPFIKNTLLLFFTIGFLKHFLAYFIGIHTYYCNNGYACGSENDTIRVSQTTFLQLFMESIIEGFLFMFLYKVLGDDRIIVAFLTGVILHLAFEMIGLHKLFCKERCKLINIYFYYI